MTTRANVYAAIDSERDYQDVRWRGHQHEPESWCLFLEDYVMQARQQATRTDFSDPDNLRAYLDTIRKIAALAVACMEQHGAPLRDGGAIDGTRFHRR